MSRENVVCKITKICMSGTNCLYKRQIHRQKNMWRKNIDLQSNQQVSNLILDNLAKQKRSKRKKKKMSIICYIFFSPILTSNIQLYLLRKLLIYFFHILFEFSNIALSQLWSHKHLLHIAPNPDTCGLDIRLSFFNWTFLGIKLG